MTDLKERGWVAKRQRFSSVPQCHLERAGNNIWGTAAGSLGCFSCRAGRALKQQPAGSPHHLQIQQTGVGGNKLNLSHAGEGQRGAGCVQSHQQDLRPFSPRAGMLRGWEAELEIMPLPTDESVLCHTAGWAHTAQRGTIPVPSPWQLVSAPSLHLQIWFHRHILNCCKSMKKQTIGFSACQGPEAGQGNENNETAFNILQ